MNNQRPEYDALIQSIADYTLSSPPISTLALETASHCLMDSIACALLALDHPACRDRLEPLTTNTQCLEGVPIIGTQHTHPPVEAARALGTQIRWLDYNDTWLAAEWGHPSDNLAAILAVADYASRHLNTPYTVHDVLVAAIQAHEIQGVLALNNSFNAVGLDHVVLVKVASTALAAKLLGCNRAQLLSAISNAWLDGQSLRTYRHAPNTGPRKSWAAGDAAARAVMLAFLASKGEAGYPSALTAPIWGFNAVYMKDKPLTQSQPFGCYVMENVLFKISFPAEFHAQTAVECAIALHDSVKNKLDQIETITIHTQAAAIRIIDKKGPLHNFADRDHCLQYMIAIGLLYGRLDAHHYGDDVALNPLIDTLRNRMNIVEDTQMTADYYDPTKRAIGNAIQVFFKDNSATEKCQIDFPVGHRRRRSEGIPKLMAKAETALATYFAMSDVDKIKKMLLDQDQAKTSSITTLLDTMKIKHKNTVKKVH